jgi:phosphatidylinositol alpha-1,6-mannosyltransferase
LRAIVFTRDFPPEHGGVQTLMERLAAHYGANALVIARRAPGDEAFDRAQPYRVERMPRFEWRHSLRAVDLLLRGVSYALRLVWGLVVLLDAIREHRPDVIWCAYAFPNGLPALIARWWERTPYVVYCHGTEALRVMARGGVGLWLLRAVIRSASRVVTHSGFMRGQLSRLAPSEKILVNELGADSGALDTHAAPLESIGGFDLTEARVLAAVGRLERRKGHDAMIAALPEIRRAHPNVCWVVVGDGPERERLRALAAQRGVADSIVFAGRLSDAEVSRLLARADLFVMPSRRIGPDVEAFGIVYLEAALFGVPSVGGASGGVPEAIEDGVTGLLCDPESPPDLAAKVTLLLGDEALRRQMGEAARRRAEARTWQTCVTKLEAEVASALSR